MPSSPLNLQPLNKNLQGNQMTSALKIPSIATSGTTNFIDDKKSFDLKCFNKRLAMEVGTCAAIVYQRLEYLIKENGEELETKTGVFRTVKKLQKEIGFMKISTLKKSIKELETTGYIDISNDGKFKCNFYTIIKTLHTDSDKIICYSLNMAKSYGLNTSLVYVRIKYYVERYGEDYGGKKWIYKSVSQLENDLPISRRSIERSTKQLEDQLYLFKRKKRDFVNRYAILKEPEPPKPPKLLKQTKSQNISRINNISTPLSQNLPSIVEQFNSSTVVGFGASTVVGFGASTVVGFGGHKNSILNNNKINNARVAHQESLSQENIIPFPLNSLEPENSLSSELLTPMATNSNPTQPSDLTKPAHHPSSTLKPVASPTESKTADSTISPTDPIKPSLEQEFDQLYSLFPRQEGNERNKETAFELYKTARHNGSTAEEIETGLIFYSQSVKNSDPKYILMPKSWLKKESWKNQNAKVFGRPHESMQDQISVADCEVVKKVLTLWNDLAPYKVTLDSAIEINPDAKTLLQRLRENFDNRIDLFESYTVDLTTFEDFIKADKKSMESDRKLPIKILHKMINIKTINYQVNRTGGTQNAKPSPSTKDYLKMNEEIRELKKSIKAKEDNILCQEKREKSGYKRAEKTFNSLPIERLEEFRKKFVEIETAKLDKPGERFSWTAQAMETKFHCYVHTELAGAWKWEDVREEVLKNDESYQSLLRDLEALEEQMKPLSKVEEARIAAYEQWKKRFKIGSYESEQPANINHQKNNNPEAGMKSLAEAIDSVNARLEG